jgi:hypothetical protein
VVVGSVVMTLDVVVDVVLSTVVVVELAAVVVVASVVGGLKTESVSLPVDPHAVRVAAHAATATSGPIRRRGRRRTAP